MFSAGATEESAAAVTGDPHVLDGLASLVDKSLLQVVGTPATGCSRRSASTALEKLDDAGEVEAARTAHARYFAAFAEDAEPRLRTGEQHATYRRLQTEHDDVIAALRWLGDAGDRRGALRLAVSLLWFWMLSGAQDEATSWLEFALAVPGDADPVDLFIAQGISALTRAMDDPDVEDRMRVLGEQLEAINDGRPLLALARPVLAVITGEHDLAEQRLAETLEHPDEWTRAAALLMRAHLAENLGDQEHMRADLARAADAFRELGDNWALGMTLSAQAGTLMLADDLDAAETVLDEATELLETLTGASGAAVLWLRLADVRVRRGDFAGARELALRAVENADLRRDEAILVRAILGRIAWLEGDLDGMREIVAEAGRRLEGFAPARPEQGHALALVNALRRMLALEEGDLDARGDAGRAGPGRGGGDDRHAGRRHGGGDRGGAVAALRARRGRRRAARRRRRPARGGGPFQPRGGASARADRRP